MDGLDWGERGMSALGMSGCLHSCIGNIVLV